MNRLGTFNSVLPLSKVKIKIHLAYIPGIVGWFSLSVYIVDGSLFYKFHEAATSIRVYQAFTTQICFLPYILYWFINWNKF